ncbi:hypothetical protein L7F22_015017 [Adiantum nelumboides]|nr:hypothetical protein [Adiantum nelumboides]
MRTARTRSGPVAARSGHRGAGDRTARTARARRPPRRPPGRATGPPDRVRPTTGPAAGGAVPRRRRRAGPARRRPVPDRCAHPGRRRGRGAARRPVAGGAARRPGRRGPGPTAPGGHARRGPRRRRARRGGRRRAGPGRDRTAVPAGRRGDGRRRRAGRAAGGAGPGPRGGAAYVPARRRCRHRSAPAGARGPGGARRRRAGAAGGSLGAPVRGPARRPRRGGAARPAGPGAVSRLCGGARCGRWAVVGGTARAGRDGGGGGRPGARRRRRTGARRPAARVVGCGAGGRRGRGDGRHPSGVPPTRLFLRHSGCGGTGQRTGAHRGVRDSPGRVDNHGVSDIPRRTASRTAKLAGLPLGVAGRAAAGFGRRLTGGDRDEIAAQLAAKSAEQLFAVLGELKGGAMKFGQALSVFEAAVPDELAEPYREALTKLQTAAPPMPMADVDYMLTQQFGRSWRSRFADFDETPAASASIGQVHRAVWRDGREVAVKVQYPGAEEALRSDLRQLSRMSRILQPLVPGMEIKPLVAELKDRMEEELDYRDEAAYQREFAAFYEDDPDVKIPAWSGPRPRPSSPSGCRAARWPRSSATAPARIATTRATSWPASTTRRRTARTCCTPTRTPATSGSSTTAVCSSSTSVPSPGCPTACPPSWSR